jgi:hypothetical protein
MKTKIEKFKQRLNELLSQCEKLRDVGKASLFVTCSGRCILLKQLIKEFDEMLNDKTINEK